MPNPFDQFDTPQAPDLSQRGPSANPFDQFDELIPEKPTLLSQAGRQLGLAGRSIINGVTGMPAMAADAGVATRNLVYNLSHGITPTLADFNPFAKTGGSHQEYELPSQSFSHALTASGVPEPQTGVEKAANFVESGLVGSHMPVPEGMGSVKGAAKSIFGGSPDTPNLAPANFVPPQDQQTLRTAEMLRQYKDKGLVVPPSTTNPTIGNKVLETISGKEATQNTARSINQTARNALAANDLGLEPEVFTPEAVKAVKNEAGQAFEAARSIPRFSTDENYSSDLDRVLSANRGANADFPGASNPDVEKVVETYRQPSFTGDSAVSAVKLLRAKASDAYRQGNSELGSAYKGISRAIEEQTERGALSLEQPPGPRQFSLDMGFANQGDISARQVVDRFAQTAHGPEGPMVYDAASGGWRIQPQTAIRPVQDIQESGPAQQIGLPFSTRAPESFGPQPEAAPTGKYSMLIDALRKARKTYAQASTIEEAMDPAGNVSGPKLAAALRRSEPLEGGLRTAAEHATSFPKANLPANSSNISHLNMYAAPMAAIEGYRLGGIPAAVLGGALPFARGGARNYLLSGMGQVGAIPSTTQSYAQMLARALANPNVLASQQQR